MIPRVRPSYSLIDLWAAVRSGRDAVALFERELAAHFGMRHALAFPYGRSAIFACLRALNLSGEVVQPAYNCVVVAHATMVGGCRPVFIDAQAGSPNQNPEDMVDRVGPQTAAVMPTSIFGVPFDARGLAEAIRRKSPRALILIDCCQCFDAAWQGQPLAAQGDAALLAFGIGKPMTTLFGGALLTNRDDLARAVCRYRDTTFRPRPWHAAMLRWGYFLASWASMCPPMVGFTDVLEKTDTPLHRYLLRLRARDAVRLPADNETLMMCMEAAIGRTQLRRVDTFIHRRREIAATYGRELAGLDGLQLVDWPQGSSYAIYAARVRPEKRSQLLAALRGGGVQGDTSLNYVVPGLECYRQHGYDGAVFPNALAWSQSVINLPNHPTMTAAQVERVVRIVRAACARG